MPITVGDITISADMVEVVFRIKHGEKIEETDTVIVEDTVEDTANGTGQAS